MKASFTASLVLLVASANADILQRAACAANNCARAVTGTANKKPDVTSRLADCSSFFSVTVTPITFTSTVGTSTITTITDTSIQPGPTTTVYSLAPSAAVPPPVQNVPDKRAMPFGQPVFVRTITIVEDTPVTETATAIPTYASACSSGGASVAYSSACSCFGAVAATTTVLAPTADTTVTVTTATITIRETVSPTADLFVKTIEVCGSGNNYDYIYAETGGAGALLAPTDFYGLDRYACCATCYSEAFSANCAGTIYDASSGRCSLYQTGGGDDSTDRCPSGRGSVFDQPGDRVQLGPCGKTRPNPVSP